MKISKIINNAVNIIAKCLCARPGVLIKFFQLSTKIIRVKIEKDVNIAYGNIDVQKR